MSKTTWIKPRHKAAKVCFSWLLSLYSKIKYHAQIVPFKESKERPFFMMMNHQTAADQFFMYCSAKRPIYMISTEDMFSIGFFSKVLSFLFAPIQIKKSGNDMRCVKTCIKVAKEGGTIAIAPEGNRTFSGTTESMKPTITKLIRATKLPVAFYRIEGGFGVEPRWSNFQRKGKIRAGVSGIMEYEEYSRLSDEEFYEVIKRELYVDDTKLGQRFTHPRCAENIERVLYICPDCGLSRFESKGSEFWCIKCNEKYTFTGELRIKKQNGITPFETVKEWYDYQNGFINDLTPESFDEKPIYEDTASLSEVILYKNKKPISKNAHLAIYKDRITIDDISLDIADIEALSCMGRRKLQIYAKENIYQIAGSSGFNPVKYTNLFFRFKNILEGDSENEFLGL